MDRSKVGNPLATLSLLTHPKKSRMFGEKPIELLSAKFTFPVRHGMLFVRIMSAHADLL